MKPLNYVLAFIILFASSCNAQTKGPLNNKKVLITYGGNKTHQPKQCVEILLPWLKSEGALVDTFSSLDIYADTNYMESVDLIIQTITTSTINKEQEQGLLTAVKNGAGIAGWHGGLGDSFRNNPKYQYMIGGQWVAHPGGMIDYTVNIRKPKDQIMRGISDFQMHSEQYYMHVDPNIQVLASTQFNEEYDPWIDGCIIPVVWKKTYGKGRVFYSSLGHVAAEFEVPEVWEILKRGIIWSSESRYSPTEKWVEPAY